MFVCRIFLWRDTNSQNKTTIHTSFLLTHEKISFGTQIYHLFCTNYIKEGLKRLNSGVLSVNLRLPNCLLYKISASENDVLVMGRATFHP